MNVIRDLAIVGLILLVIAVAVAARNPYRARLPIGSTDLSSIQKSLDRLPAEERELVKGYVARSRGDVLPAKFADPDEPLTARTVGEAIELQRRFVARMGEANAKAHVREVIRDGKLAPLREALAVELTRREILPREEVTIPPAELERIRAQTPKRAIDDTPVLVTHYHITNTSRRTIESFVADVKIRHTQRDIPQLGALDGCHITHDALLQPGESTDIRCGNTQRIASPEDRAYVDMDASALAIEWTPKRIRFSGGEELRFND